jgi:hypothetical protein
VKVIIGAAIAISAIVASAVVIPLVDPAGAAASACTATSGVTVIVDFTHFAGGKIERGCAPGRPANGLIALYAAGFATAGTVQYGDAFVCRIDGLPAPKQESCAVTPAPSAFWAYWSARPADSSWTYNALGVLDYHPKSGTIEAFAFGARVKPGVAPSAAIPTTTSTRPPTTTPTTQTPVTSPPPPVTAATLPATPGTTDPPVVALGSTTTTTERRPKPTTTTTTRGGSSTSASTSTTAGIVERSASGPRKHDDSGSPVGAILGVAIVGALALGGFAFTRARRRRPA